MVFSVSIVSLSTWCEFLMVSEPYIFDIDMASQLHDVDNFMGCGQTSCPANILDVARQSISIHGVTGGVVETYDSCVQIKVLVYSRGVADVLWEPKTLGEEHEGARQSVI